MSVGVRLTIHADLDLVPDVAHVFEFRGVHFGEVDQVLGRHSVPTQDLAALGVTESHAVRLEGGDPQIYVRGNENFSIDRIATGAS